MKNLTYWADKDSVDFFAIIPSKSAIQIDSWGARNCQATFDDIEITPENREHFLMTPPPVIRKVVYSDPMGTRYAHHFAFVASPAWGNDFRRYGGIKRNYEIQIDD